MPQKSEHISITVPVYTLAGARELFWINNRGDRIAAGLDHPEWVFIGTNVYGEPVGTLLSNVPREAHISVHFRYMEMEAERDMRELQSPDSPRAELEATQ